MSQIEQTWGLALSGDVTWVLYILSSQFVCKSKTVFEKGHEVSGQWTTLSYAL